MGMFQKKDSQHHEAMKKMSVLIQDAQKMQDWFMTKKSKFSLLADD